NPGCGQTTNRRHSSGGDAENAYSDEQHTVANSASAHSRSAKETRCNRKSASGHAERHQAAARRDGGLISRSFRSIREQAAISKGSPPGRFSSLFGTGVIGRWKAQPLLCICYGSETPACSLASDTDTLQLALIGVSLVSFSPRQKTSRRRS